MVLMALIWWIYHFWARFWPYFNFVVFRAYFGPFSLVNRVRQKMADLLMKMASNKKMQENKSTLKFNFTIEKRWPVSKFSFWHSHWALLGGGGGRWSDLDIILCVWHPRVRSRLSKCVPPLHKREAWGVGRWCGWLEGGAETDPCKNVLRIAFFFVLKLVR